MLLSGIEPHPPQAADWWDQPGAGDELLRVLEEAERGGGPGRNEARPGLLHDAQQASGPRSRGRRTPASELASGLARG